MTTNKPYWFRVVEPGKQVLVLDSTAVSKAADRAEILVVEAYEFLNELGIEIGTP